MLMAAAVFRDGPSSALLITAQPGAAAAGAAAAAAAATDWPARLTNQRRAGEMISKYSNQLIREGEAGAVEGIQ